MPKIVVDNIYQKTLSATILSALPILYNTLTIKMSIIHSKYFKYKIEMKQICITFWSAAETNPSAPGVAELPSHR